MYNFPTKRIQMSWADIPVEPPETMRRQIQMLLNAIQLVCDPRGSQDCSTPTNALNRLNELRMIREWELILLQNARINRNELAETLEELAGINRRPIRYALRLTWDKLCRRLGFTC